MKRLKTDEAEFFNYYVAELKRILPVDEFGVSIVVGTTNGKTKGMSLNPMSLKAIEQVFNKHFKKYSGFNELLESDDESAENELLLYIENDADLYRQQFMPIIKNIQRKIKAKKYNHKLAPKLWLYLVENGAKKYAKEFATSAEWSKIFSPAVRKKVASDMANNYYERIKNGEYE